MLPPIISNIEDEWARYLIISHMKYIEIKTAAWRKLYCFRRIEAFADIQKIIASAPWANIEIALHESKFHYADDYILLK